MDFPHVCCLASKPDFRNAADDKRISFYPLLSLPVFISPFSQDVFVMPRVHVESGEDYSLPVLLGFVSSRLFPLGSNSKFPLKIHTDRF